MVDTTSRNMLTKQVMSIKRDRTSGQSLVDEPARGWGPGSRADGDAARYKSWPEEGESGHTGYDESICVCLPKISVR